MNAPAFDNIPLEHRLRAYRNKSELQDMPPVFGPPETLLSLGRPDDGLRLMLLGLHQHYIDCLLTGRIDKWKCAAHAVVELAACVPEARLSKRSELG